jgi:uncharacterized membrane protein YhaH (DUF805 family)
MMVMAVIGVLSVQMELGLWPRIIAVGFISPSIAAAVRRLHDVGKSGWNTLWIVLPVAGFLYVLFLFSKEGEKSKNKYGERPHRPH